LFQHSLQYDILDVVAVDVCKQNSVDPVQAHADGIQAGSRVPDPQPTVDEKCGPVVPDDGAVAAAGAAEDLNMGFHGQKIIERNGVGVKLLS
jgi:hypothetical protein